MKYSIASGGRPSRSGLRGPLTGTALLVLLGGLFLCLSACTPPEDPLSPEERQWLTEHMGKIRLAATPSNKPFEYFDEKDRYRGMVADYIKLLEKKLNFRFELVQAYNLKELLRMAENREVDVIGAFAGNPARFKHMSFTRPYLVLPSVILVNKSYKQFLTLKDLQKKGMDLALPKEYAVVDYVHKYFPRLHVQPVYNYLAGLLHVSFDEIDATIITLPQASYYIESKGITNLRVAGYTDYKIYNRMAVRSDMPMLTSILQKGLDRITEKEHEAIYRKWVTLDQHYLSILRQNKHIWGIALAVAALILFSLGLVIVWNRSLTRRVAQRTGELKRELMQGKRLLAAIEQTEDGIFILDTRQRLEYANPAFLRMSGYSLEEIRQRHIAFIRAVSPAPDSTDIYERLWDELEQGQVWRGQTTYRRKDGSTFKTDLTVSPVVNEVGEVTNYVEVVRDITDKLRLEHRLRQKQKMEELGTLAGGIAHDFNNMVAAIHGYAELALPATEEGSRPRANLERVLRVAERAKDMVHQILVFSRRREPERSRVELGAIVREVVGLLGASVPSTISVRCHEDRGRETIWADPGQVHQVIMNLGTNAVYALRDQGGEIEIFLKAVRVEDTGTGQGPDHDQPAPGNYMRLRVQDNGPGISEDVMARIFDPFFTTKPRGEGTGMGLALVHGVMGSLGGEISVRNRETGGCRFDLYFPLSDRPLPETRWYANSEEQTPDNAGDVGERKGRGGGARILLVDDEPDMVRIVTEMLEYLGYVVCGCNDSCEALERFRAAPQDFDLLLTDQTMPELTGDRLAGEVHSLRPELPVVLFTGFSERIVELDLKSLGVHKVMIKPFRQSELALAVEDVLRNSGARARGAFDRS